MAAAAPGYADSLHLLGVASCQSGDLVRGAVLIGRALAASPARADVWSHLGNALAAVGRRPVAAAAYRRGLALAPAQAEAESNLAAVHAIEHREPEAEVHYRRALALAPGHLNPAYGLAVVLCRRRLFEPAAAIFAGILRDHPEHSGSHEKLATILTEQRRFDAALAHGRRAVALEPAAADAHHIVAKIHALSDRVREAVIAYRRTLALRPDDAEAHSNLIFALDFSGDLGIAEQQALRRAWHDRHGRRWAPAKRPLVGPVGDRKLRIGYVSADFGHHSAAYSFGAMIFGRDRSRFEAVLYSGVTNKDDLTERFRSAADLWRDCATMSDDEMAARIGADAIDILVDLSAHTGGNRLLVFARKPAPIQVTGWGQATGTGLATIDYFMADRVLVPPESRPLFAEQVVDLPCFMSYSAPAYAPDVPPLPDRPPIFGCLNRLSKISEAALDLWSELLKGRPEARLLLKDPALSIAAERTRILSAFGCRGVDGARILLRGGTPHVGHLAAYGEIDVALDPFPQNGGISTFEALWMGVPVVARLGGTLPSRASGAILHALGFPQWVARSEEDYVAIAAQVIGDREELRRRRRTLRASLAASVLCDPARYCGAVEAAYREMWRRFCADAR